jgi:hypothetical protein
VTGADSGTTDGVRAADVYEAALQPVPGGRVKRSARLAAAFVAELAWGLLPAPTLFDVVVTRRADGAEVLRVGAGDPNVPGDMLRLVDQQLADLDPATFLDEWGAEEPPGRVG